MSFFFVWRSIQAIGGNVIFSLADSIKNSLERVISNTSNTFSNKNGSRSRKLSVEKTVHLLIGVDGSSLAKELHRVGIDATPATVSQCRAAIPASVFQDVFSQFNAACNDSEMFRGYRLLAVDGTSVNIPRNPNAPSFVHNESAPQGYNQLHLNPLFDLCIKELYHLRWGIELGFRDLKYTTGLSNILGKRDAYTKQEIWAAMTMFNLTSRIIREVVIKQPKDGVYAYKVNFKMATAFCKEYFRTPGADGAELMRKIARHTVPIRPGRVDERNLKAKGFVGFTYRVAV